jgi:hypothetical protein
MLVEPVHLRPGEPFTITLFLRSDFSQSQDIIQLKLNIEGPSGDYHFVLSLKGPLPAHGVSVVQITPELLADPCQRQYQISPGEMVSVPGVYTLRAILPNPGVVSAR